MNIFEKYFGLSNEDKLKIAENINENLRNKVKNGLLVEKLCFLYCGDDKCNCTGGAQHTAFEEEVLKFLK